MRHMRNLQPIWQSYHACERWLSLAMTVDPKQLHFLDFQLLSLFLIACPSLALFLYPI